MSVSRSARSVLNGSMPKPRASSQCPRSFHSSTNMCDRRRSRFKSIKASDMGLITGIQSPTGKGGKPSIKGLKPYTSEDAAELDRRYTPEQRKVIEIGERAIDDNDLFVQGHVRIDPGRIPYLDDFSKNIPVLDNNIKKKLPKLPQHARIMNRAEAKQDLAKMFGRISMAYARAEIEAQAKGTSRAAIWEEECREKGLDPEDHEDPMIPNRLDALLDLNKYNSPFIIPGEENRVLESNSAFRPALPVMKDIKDSYINSNTVDEKDPEGKYTRLRMVTGKDLAQITELNTRVLVSHRVVQQTRLGKIPSNYVLAVAGNGNGMLGIGEGKAAEIEDARHKARYQAIKSMKPIPRYEQRTIFGDLESRVCGTTVKLMARSPGFGLRCQHLIFEMARAAGIHDLAAKVPGSRNKMNTVKATYQALVEQRLPDDIARGRGKKLVDVRKVYYGGLQPVPRMRHERRA